MSRVCATKTTPLPADFEAKHAEFIRIGSAILAQHQVPPELVYNIDETSVQFVNLKKRTRALEGAKRVRLLGVGHQKPCITVTLGATATGEVLPPQYIFAGDYCSLLLLLFISKLFR